MDGYVYGMLICTGILGAFGLEPRLLWANLAIVALLGGTAHVVGWL